MMDFPHRVLIFVPGLIENLFTKVTPFHRRFFESILTRGSGKVVAIYVVLWGNFLAIFIV